MRIAISLIVIALLASADTYAQRRRSQTRRPAAKEPAKQPASKMVGTPVVITTKTGDLIRGQLIDLSAYSIKIKSGNLESTISLETIAAISFGTTPAAPPQQAKEAPEPSAELGRDLNELMRSVESISSATRAGTDYTEYGRLLTDLRRDAERFIDKYSSSENTTDIRAVALISGALTDFTWARTIWTLKLGRSGEGTVSESDSPVIADTLALYPELRTSAATGKKFSGDKLIAGLWKQASEKLDRVRALVKP
ncbi:MAG TPA: hypothetical protein VNO14_15465 [Blastocatellia bacterium]|nr:hypothetical protein [Blastocatellia bacterium]